MGARVRIMTNKWLRALCASSSSSSMYLVLLWVYVFLADVYVVHVQLNFLIFDATLSRFQCLLLVSPPLSILLLLLLIAVVSLLL